MSEVHLSVSVFIGLCILALIGGLGVVYTLWGVVWPSHRVTGVICQRCRRESPATPHAWIGRVWAMFHHCPKKGAKS